MRRKRHDGTLNHWNIDLIFMDVMCCDVGGDDGSSMRQRLNHHANPVAMLKYTKHAWDTHFCTEAYVGIHGSESAKICAYVSTPCHYEKKDVDTSSTVILRNWNKKFLKVSLILWPTPGNNVSTISILRMTIIIWVHILRTIICGSTPPVVKIICIEGNFFQHHHV